MSDPKGSVLDETPSWRRGPLDEGASGLGAELMPELDEGDLMYLPTTLPGIAIGKVKELLQHTDRLIAVLPEVRSNGV